VALAGRPFYGEFAWAYDLLVAPDAAGRCGFVADLFARRGLARPGLSEVIDERCLPMNAKGKKDFDAVHAGLREILRRYERGSLRATADRPGDYTLVGPPTEASKGRDVWFGAVQTRKGYVSYHLMPVYAFPELLDAVSPALRKRMQGKSCFNFREVDEELFGELRKLTESGYKRFKREKLIK